jgi:hypothetical protein
MVHLQMDYIQMCIDSPTDEDSCLSVSLGSQYYQCCVLTLTTPSNISEVCTLSSPVEEMEKELASGRAKASMKELYGYTKYDMLSYDPNSELFEELKVIYNYKCKDGELSFRYGYDTYTEEEIKILRSEKHCLVYSNSYITYYDYLDRMPSKEDCFNADLLQSTKDTGISCGFIEIHLNFQSGKKLNFNTCNLFNPEMAETRKLDKESNNLYQSIVQKISNDQGEILIDYKIELSDSNGKKMNYNSLTGQIEDSIVSSAEEKESNSQIVKISKYLLLLFIIVLF